MGLIKKDYVDRVTPTSAQNLNDIQAAIVTLEEQTGREANMALKKVNYIEGETPITAQNLNDIQDAVLGLEESVGDAYEAGQKAEYDRFWDGYQQNGNRTDYTNAFAGQGWTTDSFKPKYDIITSNGYMMFRLSTIAADLPALLKELGVKLTFNAALLQYTFYGTTFTRIGEIEVTGGNAPYAQAVFAASKQLVTIDKLTCVENGVFTNFFDSCTSLANLTIEGVIGRDFKAIDSPLTVNSMKSIINALKNYSGTSNELKYKISFSSACWAALEASGASPSGGTWKDYVASLGWSY